MAQIKCARRLWCLCVSCLISLLVFFLKNGHDIVFMRLTISVRTWARGRNGWLPSSEYRFLHFLYTTYIKLKETANESICVFYHNGSRCRSNGHRRRYNNAAAG
jgi:hypothetical protein